MNKFKHLNEYLTIHDQLHVLKYWNDLNAQQQDTLYDQLINIDLNQLKSIISNSKQPNDLINQLDFTQQQQQQLPQPLEIINTINYEQTGLKAIHDNKLAVITLAGGLSKRLSVSYPKGLYSCDLLSSKSLFQLQAEKLIKIKQLSNLNKKTLLNNTIDWYIMTSDHTHTATIDHFKANNYFGLQSKNVLFFKQKQFPCLNRNNKLILENKFKIRMAPNGSGGLYEALLDNQILTDMKQKNIQFIHICGIENILIKIADPIFIGYCLETNTQCGIKITEKIRHNEPITNLVFNSHVNKLNLVDFTLINSDLSTQIKFETNNKDSLFNFGDICSYFIEFDLLKTLAIKFKLDNYKLNTCRLTCLNLSTDLEEKQKCFYFEKFLTHSFQDFKLFRVDRNNEYAPLEYMHHKNLYHTKYVCKKSLNDLHYDWLIRAGGKFYYTNTQDLIKYNDAQNVCEISPLVSYYGEVKSYFIIFLYIY
jgi:UDP-N-acetylglucosamine/UDP-N-acetylgalactosamine diphosphorylase